MNANALNSSSLGTSISQNIPNLIRDLNLLQALVNGSITSAASTELSYSPTSASTVEQNLCVDAYKNQLVSIRDNIGQLITYLNGKLTTDCTTLKNTIDGLQVDTKNTIVIFFIDFTSRWRLININQCMIWCLQTLALFRLEFKVM